MKITWQDWALNGGAPADENRWCRDTDSDSSVGAAVYLDPNAYKLTEATGWFASVYVIDWDGLPVTITRSVELTAHAADIDGAKILADAFAAGVIEGIARDVVAGKDVTEIK